MAHDLVIRGGTVVDGTGLAPFPADVAVHEGRIVKVGKVADRGDREIDAEGQVVTPGFIDGHTHMDAQVFWDQLGTNSCWHGVTTAVMGHTGFTLAPASRQDSQLVVRNLERAEDISGVAMAAGIDWTWTTFAEYLDVVDRLPKGINYAANIGHSALRTYVMGERAFTEAAGSDDLEAMAVELEAALQAGAIGFTTSRNHNHETSDHRPVASRMADWDEVVYLVSVMGRTGTGIFQIVDDVPDDDGQAERTARFVDLAVSTGVPIAVVANNPSNHPLDLLRAASAAGGRVFGLTHPRGIGTMSSFRTQLPFDNLPTWRELRARPLDEVLQALGDPDLRARLVREAHEGPYPEALGGEARKPDFERMQVLRTPVPPHATVAEMARERGVDPVELMMDLAVETDGSQFYVQTNVPFDHDGVKELLRDPQTVMAFSDSGAHVSQMSDASVQTHLLAHWVRDRQDITLPEAIRMMTLAPARAWGFADRGLVWEGMQADLNVFDPDVVGPAMPKVVHDLPAGEPRLEQKAVGISATLVAGEVIVEHGEPTGARPGRLLRGPLGRTGRDREVAHA